MLQIVYVEHIACGQDVYFKISVQHDCRRGKCLPTVIRREHQERAETEREIQLISHSDDDYFILNMGALHNFVEVCRILPRDLIKPLPHQTDRQAFHRQTAHRAYEKSTAKKVQASEKRQATMAAKVQNGLTGSAGRPAQPVIRPAQVHAPQLQAPLCSSANVTTPHSALQSPAAAMLMGAEPIFRLNTQS